MRFILSFTIKLYTCMNSIISLASVWVKGSTHLLFQQYSASFANILVSVRKLAHRIVGLFSCAYIQNKNLYLLQKCYYVVLVSCLCGGGPHYAKMRCVIPEVAYHNRDPVLSIDFQVNPDRIMRSTSVADPGSGAFLTLGSGMGKKSGSGSGMNNPDHISESLETIFLD